MDKPTSAGCADYFAALLLLILLALSGGRIIYEESLLKDTEKIKVEFTDE